MHGVSFIKILVPILEVRTHPQKILATGLVSVSPFSYGSHTALQYCIWGLTRALYAVFLVAGEQQRKWRRSSQSVLLAFVVMELMWMFQSRFDISSTPTCFCVAEDCKGTSCILYDGNHGVLLVLHVQSTWICWSSSATYFPSRKVLLCNSVMN